MATRTISQETTTARDARRSPRDALLAGLPVTERRLALAGISTPILEGGRGEPIVLLHGPGEFAPKWLRVIPALAERYRVVAPDLPGHGESRVHEGPLDVDHLMRWLEALIGETCPAPPVLVGHVLGGTMAARFAARHPEMVRRLVLVDSLGLAPFRPSLRFALSMLHFMARPGEGTYTRFMRQCAWDLDDLRTAMDDRWDPFVAYQLQLARTPAVQRAVRTLMKHVGLPAIPTDELAGIRVPTTLIWGRHDRANPPRIAERASARYGWPLHVIEECADDPPRDRPEDFLRVLEAGR